jgi:hypothetical protein
MRGVKRSDGGGEAGGLRDFARELGRVAAAVAATFVGLVLLSACCLWFVEDVEEWWQALVAGALALALAGLLLWGIAASAGAHLADAAAGWAGLALRRAPRSFSRAAGARALADLLAFAACAAGGLLAFRAGAVRGELHWSIQGLLLVVAGGLFGLVPLAPRLALLRARRAGRAWKVVDGDATRDDALVAPILAACLGVGLSMGVTDAVAVVRARRAGAPTPVDGGGR